MSTPVLGIDLGTTNSVVACADEHRVRVLRDEDGQLLTPSTVSFDPSGRMLVGHEARERRLLDAPNTVFSVKRLIGRPFRSAEVKRAAERLPFKLEEGPSGGVSVRVHGESYSLSEVSSFILRRMRAIAESALGQPCVNAVITVPANFNELQRMATRDAGRIAGLNVLRILNEPTAAALAYGYRAKQGQRIAVYDLGGGTFDISILELSGDVIEVVATAGDTSLGGDDLDTLIADRMVAEFERQYGVSLANESQQYERVRLAAEWIKCQLSHQQTAEAIVKEVAWGSGQRAIDLRFKLSRPELQQLATPLIMRTFASCEEALRLANIRPTQLDGVILVGGQTRTPAVRQLVAEFFGLTPQTSVDPELVVAQGAALQGYALSGVPAAAEAQKSTLLGNPPAPPGPGAPADDPLPRAVASNGFEDEPTRVSQDHELPFKKRSELEFEDLPTTIDFRGDPDDELTKIGEYVTAREVEEALAGARELPTDSRVGGSTEPGVGPTAPPPAASPAAAARGGGLLGRPPLQSKVAGKLPPITRPLARTVPPAAPPRSGPTAARTVPPAAPPRSGPTPARTVPPAAPPRPQPATVPLRTLSTPARSLPPAPSLALPSQRPLGTAGQLGARPAAAGGGSTPDAMPRTAASSSAGTAPGLPPVRPEDLLPPPSASEPQQPMAAVGGGPPSAAAPATSAARSEPELRATRERSWAPSIAPLASHAVAAQAPANDGSEVVVIDPSIFLSESQLLRSQFPGPPSHAPLLLDVTPHTLSVETAGGFCEPIVERNAPIPTEQTRVFSTSQDDQVTVSVRVCQGESRRTDENQALGQIQLLGLRPARRGEVSIAVTFIIDADGTLNVKAIDRTTGLGQAIRVDLVGAIGERELERMRERQRAASFRARAAR